MSVKPITEVLMSHTTPSVRHYTLSFPTQTKIRYSCGQGVYKMLQRSFFAIIPYNCFIHPTNFIISNLNDKLKGQTLKIVDIPKENMNSTVTRQMFKLTSIHLNNLHAANREIMLQSPVHFSKDKDKPLYDDTTVHTSTQCMSTH